MDALKARLGPLPTWAWLALLTVLGLGWYLWSQHKSGSSSSAASGTAQVPETVNEVQITETPPAAPPEPPPVSPPPVHHGGKPPGYRPVPTPEPGPRHPHKFHQPPPLYPPPGRRPPPRPVWNPPPVPPPGEPPPYHPPTHHKTHKHTRRQWQPTGKPVRFAAPQDQAEDQEMQEA